MPNIRRRALGALALCAAAAAAPLAVAAPPDCTLATLSGTYVFSANGFDAKGNRSDFAGFISYDGKGRVSERMQATDGSRISLSGTYTMAAGCEATIEFDGGRKGVAFVAPGGERYSYVVVAGGSVASDAVRVSRKELRLR